MLTPTDEQVQQMRETYRTLQTALDKARAAMQRFWLDANLFRDADEAQRARTAFWDSVLVLFGSEVLGRVIAD